MWAGMWLCCLVVGLARSQPGRSTSLEDHNTRDRVEEAEEFQRFIKFADTPTNQQSLSHKEQLAENADPRWDDNTEKFGDEFPSAALPPQLHRVRFVGAMHNTQAHLQASAALSHGLGTYVDTDLDKDEDATAKASSSGDADAELDQLRAEREAKERKTSGAPASTDSAEEQDEAKRAEEQEKYDKSTGMISSSTTLDPADEPKYAISQQTRNEMNANTPPPPAKSNPNLFAGNSTHHSNYSRHSYTAEERAAIYNEQRLRDREVLAAEFKGAPSLYPLGMAEGWRQGFRVGYDDFLEWRRTHSGPPPDVPPPKIEKDFERSQKNVDKLNKESGLYDTIDNTTGPVTSIKPPTQPITRAEDTPEVMEATGAVNETVNNAIDPDNLRNAASAANLPGQETKSKEDTAAAEPQQPPAEDPSGLTKGEAEAEEKNTPPASQTEAAAAVANDPGAGGDGAGADSGNGGGGGELLQTRFLVPSPRASLHRRVLNVGASSADFEKLAKRLDHLSEDPESFFMR